jgi:predicted nucleic acid-binding protein
MFPPLVSRQGNPSRLIELARGGKLRLAVSGDKELLRLVRYDSIRIVTPSDFFAVAQGRGREI